MKLGDGVEWGLHCVAMLATLPEGSALPAKALAEYHGVSETYLLKALQALSGAKILESVPGPKGGYRLARDPDNLTFFDVVVAIEGREPAFRCSEIRQRGPVCLQPDAYKLPCAIHVAMQQAEQAWRNSLKSQTIGELARYLAQDLDPKLIELTAVWIDENARSKSKPSEEKK